MAIQKLRLIQLLHKDQMRIFQKRRKRLTLIFKIKIMYPTPTFFKTKAQKVQRY
jgi:hypothetical protein